SVSGYYAWCKREPSQHSREDAELAEQVKVPFQANRGVYGSPGVHAQLQSQGILCHHPFQTSYFLQRFAEVLICDRKWRTAGLKAGQGFNLLADRCRMEYDIACEPSEDLLATFCSNQYYTVARSGSVQ